MRVRKQYGERTLHFDKTQEARTKYIFVYEGQETEVQYFQGIIDKRCDLNISPLVDLLPVLRGTLQLSHSHPLKILKYIEDHIENYNTVNSMANKIVDYCFENLEIKENDIYNVKDLYNDILSYICKKYKVDDDCEFKLRSDILEDFCEDIQQLKNDLGSNVGLLISELINID